MSQPGTVKVCRTCGQPKVLSEFRRWYDRKRGKHYVRGSCRQCASQQQYERRSANIEQHREYERQLYRKHRRKILKRKDILKRMRRTQVYGSPKVVPVSRDEIIARDGNHCYLCGRHLRRSEINLDHVVPLSRGGTHTPDNLRVCCVQCNVRKGSRLLEEIDSTFRPFKKTCTHCFETKPIEQFSTRGPVKYQGACKVCVASLQRQRRADRRNITVIDSLNEVYKCNDCGEEWTPEPEDGLDNIRWYWRCPNGCNHDGNPWRPGERTCSHCNRVLPIEEFAGRGKNRRPECRECCASRGRQKRAATRNLTVVDSVSEIYRCNDCGAEWHPELPPGKKHMRYWWRCPNGCNS